MGGACSSRRLEHGVANPMGRISRDPSKAAGGSDALLLLHDPALQACTSPAYKAAAAAKAGQPSSSLAPTPKEAAAAKNDDPAPSGSSSDSADSDERVGGTCTTATAAAAAAAASANPRSPAPAMVSALLLPRPRPCVPVAQRGVRLRFLQRLLDSGAADAAWTTQELVHRFVRPSTEAHECCLFDLVPAEDIGKPRYFVSHAWATHTIGDLLTLLRDYAQQQEGFEQQGAPLGRARSRSMGRGSMEALGGGAGDACVWLDVFAVNQHSGASKQDKGNAITDVAEVVASTESTLLCLDNRGAALRRIWCLYEVRQTCVAKGPAKLAVLLAPQRADVAALASAFTLLDASAAEATAPRDREHLLSELRDGLGHALLNQELRSNLLDSARLEVKHAPAGAARAALLERAAVVCRASREDREAEPLLRQALDQRVGMHGEDDVRTISTLDLLAACLDEQGQHAAAEPTYRRAFEARRRTLGADHPSTLASLGNLATCLDDQRRHAEAEALHREAWEANARVHGRDSEPALEALDNLAFCVGDQGRPEEAEALLKKALEARTRVLGATHAGTLAAMNHLANCIDDQGRHAEAEAMYREALEVACYSRATSSGL